jgi:ABC-type multidrug transport system ATPase subunit
LQSLTVRENLAFSAKLRLSTSVSAATRDAIVDEVLALLGLNHIQHLVVGISGSGGISGGQRKRVSIGCELAAVPSIVLMDEPTSGLDATSTSEVLCGLKALTNAGMTIVCVIHQPRFAAFQLFDQVNVFWVNVSFVKGACMY